MVEDGISVFLLYFNLITLVTWLLCTKRTLLPYNRFLMSLNQEDEVSVIEEFGNYDGFRVVGSCIVLKKGNRFTFRNAT